MDSFDTVVIRCFPTVAQKAYSGSTISGFTISSNRHENYLKSIIYDIEFHFNELPGDTTSPPPSGLRSQGSAAGSLSGATGCYHVSIMSYDPKDLIRQAFRQAARSGKDPSRMSVAVLKNRMLALSGDAFSEKRHNASSFLQFLRSNSDLILLDASAFPPIAQLRIPDSDPPSDPINPVRDSVPGDIWRAILDYSSDTRYVWDKALERARPAQPGESLPQLPTITRERLIEWKTGFAEEQVGLDETEKGRVYTWAKENLATRSLPARLRGPWNHKLKAHVQKRFGDFAEEHSLAVPSKRVTEQPDPDVERLRHLLHECIKVMTGAELRELRLPPDIPLRARTPSRSDDKS